MPLPPAVPSEVVKMIETKTWSDSPNERYTMAEVAKFLERHTNTTRPDFSTLVVSLRGWRRGGRAEGQRAEQGEGAEEEQEGEVSAPLPSYSSPTHMIKPSRASFLFSCTTLFLITFNLVESSCSLSFLLTVEV